MAFWKPYAKPSKAISWRLFLKLPSPLTPTLSLRGEAAVIAHVKVCDPTSSSLQTRDDAAGFGGGAGAGAGRRHGYHDPGARARRGRFSRRALRHLEPRGARQQRSA